MDDAIIRSKAKSAILGAMVGDALGASVEFFTATDAREIIKEYNYFKDGLVGNGPFNMSPGQFTDDTEMGLAAMAVMVKHGKYDQAKVAEAYHQWYKSRPISIGGTIKAAVSQPTLEKMLAVAGSANTKSISNGSLMRLPIIIALHYNKTRFELITAVTQDVALTHGHPDLCAVAIVYASMLYEAIRGSSASDVYEKGRQMANLNEFNGIYCPLVSDLYRAVDNGENTITYNGRVWSIDNIDPQNMGFCGYAMWLLLLCLKNHTAYATAMIDIASRGNDSDSQCCIVGAVMAALYPVPKKWIDSVMKFSNQNRFRTYPIANPAVWTKWLTMA